MNVKNVTLTVAVVFVVLFVGLFTTARVRAAEAPPNFIVVFCDNLGYGDIEPFGSQLHRTPNLNRMAREGRKFNHFYVSAGVCTPSRASLMTGCYAQRIGMHDNERDGWVLRPVSRYGLHPDEETIAEILKPRGYATAIIGKWHLGDQAPFLPTRQGFDWFFGVPYSDDMTARVWEKDGSEWPPLPLMENDRVIEAPCDRDGLTRRYTEKAVEWIREHRQQPFFLYFPQAMPGSTSKPFASPEFKGKSRNGPWGDAIEELDWSIGRILDTLLELEIADNTLVLWTSDNGAPVKPGGDLSRGSNGPLHGRGYTTAEGAFRVPTLAWQPGRIPAGTECNEMATTMDLLPTFAKLAGAEPPTKKIDGKNIAPLLFGESEAKTPHEAFFYYQQRQLQAVRSGPWKLFLPVIATRHPHFGKGMAPQDLLIHVVNDPASQHNLADQNPEIVKRLTALAESARQELGDADLRGTGQRAPGELAEGEAPVPQTLTKSRSALDVIESVRGGRHWVDNETDPPRSPEESLAAFEIEEGFDIRLFAAEPLVRDPVSIAFDERGRMFVVEYGDYPEGPPNGGEPLSKIVLLEDTDGDSVADKRTVFAEGLDFAHSIMPYRGGLLVGAKTKVLHLTDLDGDNVADRSDVLFDGFTPAHPQMQIGNPCWGIDNWVYLNYGPGNVYSSRRPDRVVKLPRKDFRFNPQTLEFNSDAGMGQFGNTIDRWGRRFYCTNRNPIMTTFMPNDVLFRNPYRVVSKAFYDVGKAGGETRVYPLVSMKSNYLSHAGTHTSACGTTAYLGDLSADGKRYQDSVFVCEPIGHLVTRSIIESEGLRLAAKRAEDKRDFLASTDTWFRPASLATGPDGGLYLADMYRLWVEHPKFLPEEIASKLNWRAGDDRGRIYRIVPSGADSSESYRAPKTTADAVELLTQKNAWKQFTGQRLIIEAQATETEARVRQLLRHENPTTRLHALWTLSGLKTLQMDDLTLLLADENVAVRVDALRLADSMLGESAVFEGVRRATDDEDVRVRYAAALTLAQSSDVDATRLLAKLAARDGADAMFVDGFLSSVRFRSGAILEQLISDEAFHAAKGKGRADLVRRLAMVVGCRANMDEVAQTIGLLSDQDPAASWWEVPMIDGLARGLQQYRGTRLSVQLLIAKPSIELRHTIGQLKRSLAYYQAFAADASQPIEKRRASISLLAHQPFSQSEPVFRELMAFDQPADVQAACLEAMVATRSPKVADVLLELWPGLSPVVRGLATSELLRRADSTLKTLEAMESGTIDAKTLGIDQRVRLLKHSSARIREAATKLFGGAVSSNRRQVASEYEVALEMECSTTRGAAVFQRVCANCHRIEGKGKMTGPDLSDSANRSKLALLYDILDPNSKVEPRYLAQSVLTSDGTIYRGLVSSETSDAVVVTMAGGKQATVRRADIESIKVDDVSLMPEGIEKDVSREQMADLLEYLTRRK